MEDSTVATTTLTVDVDETEDDDDAAQAALDAEADALFRRADNLSVRIKRDGGTAEEKLLGLCELLSEALGEDHTGERYYPPVEVLGWMARAVEMDCEVPVVGKAVLRRVFRLELIPNARFRARYEELHASGAITSSKSLAYRLGITKRERGQTVGDGSAVERMLGLVPTADTRGRGGGGEEYKRLRLFVTYEQADALAHALGMTNHEAGV
jgi:hypothetical protein